MYIADSLKEKSSFIFDNFMVNKRSEQKENREALNSVLKQEKLSEGSESYAVFLSERAMMLAKAQQDEDGSLIVNKDKIVNQNIKKFCEENGIDMSQPIEKLDSFIVTEEMKQEKIQKEKKDSALKDILTNVYSFIHAFGDEEVTFIGMYPSEAIYTMYEKRFSVYVKKLSEYIDKYGKEPEMRQHIEGLLNENNTGGTNEVANLVKEITDRIYSGQEDTVKQLVKDRAKEAFEHTYGKEIADSNEAESKRREKFMKELKKTNERIENEREALTEKIKKLREKILKLQQSAGANGTPKSEQLQSLEKELEELTRRLSKLHTQAAPSDSQDWSDMSVMTWGITGTLKYLQSKSATN